jgi:hypothetical protein
LDEPAELKPPGEVLGTSTDDTTPPFITSNINDSQTFSGVASITMMVDELYPLEYSIHIFHPDGSQLVADGQPVGIVQNPATGTSLTFDWDTAVVPNGDYRVVMKASDTADHVQTLTVAVITSNSNGSSTFPPIQPELEPMSVNQSIPAPPTPMISLPQNAANNRDTETKILGAQDNPLAKRMNDAQTAESQPVITSPDRCASFFGVCWYVSVPITAIATSIALAFVRFRQRVT